MEIKSRRPRSPACVAAFWWIDRHAGTRVRMPLGRRPAPSEPSHHLPPEPARSPTPTPCSPSAPYVQRHSVLCGIAPRRRLTHDRRARRSKGEIDMHFDTWYIPLQASLGTELPTLLGALAVLLLRGMIALVAPNLTRKGRRNTRPH